MFTQWRIVPAVNCWHFAVRHRMMRHRMKVTVLSAVVLTTGAEELHFTLVPYCNLHPNSAKPRITCDVEPWENGEHRIHVNLDHRLKGV